MDVENVDLEGQLTMFTDEVVEQNHEENDDEFNDELKAAIVTRMQSIYNDGMVVGFQTACHTALDKIYKFESSPGKKSNNDHKRLLKDLKKLFETGISRKVDTYDKEELPVSAETEVEQE